MEDQSRQPDEQSNVPLTQKTVSRRQFLELAGITGAALGAAGGLGGLLAACGGGETTTTAGATTTAGPATTAGVTTTTGPATTAGPTTTASAAAEKGRELKLGWISPLTGGLATFGTADKFNMEKWQKVVADGWVCGDGKNHPINFILKDSQSDTNRASQVAGDLIMNDKIDIMMVASTPDTVNPVADQCEAMEMPCYSNDSPWEPYFYGRGGTPDKPFKWTYHQFWGLEDDIVNVYMNMWDRIPTNKVVGAMWPNDVDGVAWAQAFTAAMPTRGYTLVDPGRYQNGTEDYTAQISEFKKKGCEILTGVPIPPDFTNLWKACLQQGFKPKLACIGKAMDLPAGYQSLGSSANNFMIECQWTPKMPFLSSLTGETCQQLADEFEASAKEQWAGYLLHYAIFEVVADALKRCPNVDDKEAIIDAISKSKVDTIAGPVDFTTEPKLHSWHPVKNVCRSPLVGGQWLESTKWPRDLMVVDNSNYPGVSVEAESKPLVY